MIPWLNRDRDPVTLPGQPVPEAFPPAAEDLLASVAAALTACDAAGYSVKLKHGAVYTRVGYVLPLGDGEWCARTLNWTEFSPPGSDDEDETSLT